MQGVPSKVAEEVKNLSTLTSLSIFWLAEVQAAALDVMECEAEMATS